MDVIKKLAALVTGKPVAEVVSMPGGLLRANAWRGGKHSSATFRDPVEAQEWAKATAKGEL